MGGNPRGEYIGGANHSVEKMTASYIKKVLKEPREVQFSPKTYSKWRMLSQSNNVLNLQSNLSISKLKNTNINHNSTINSNKVLNK